jgi:hypothetical protein
LRKLFEDKLPKNAKIFDWKNRIEESDEESLE